MRRVWFAVLLAGSIPVAAMSQTDRAAGLPHAELLAKQSACIACHAAEGAAADRLSFVSAPSLMDVASRRQAGWIAEFLSSEDSPHPTVTRSSEEAHAIAAFLSGGLEPDFVAAEVSLSDRSTGEKLFKEVGCYACHDDNFAGRDLAAGWSVHGLAEALHEPASHPAMAGRMPDMELTKREAFAISAWLLRDQEVGDEPEIVPGLKYSYYEEDSFGGMGPDWSKLEAKEKGVTSVVTHQLGSRKERYGLVLTGMIKVPTDGAYTFWTRSDDGSDLWINGERVVDNLQIHPPQTRNSDAIELSAGWHDLRITFFEQGGGEELQAGWSGPGIDRREFLPEELAHSGSVPLPIQRPINGDAELGRELFGARNCAACHQNDGIAGRPSTALAELVAEPQGCLSESPSGAAVDFGFSSEQRELLVNMLKNRGDLARERSANEQVFVAMQQHQCTSCHARDGVGAPTDAVLASFVGADDLGEEGRVPPTLHDVGAKLTEGALSDSIAQGLKYRPSVKTRMPAFHDVDAQLASNLGRALRATDRSPAVRTAPRFDAEEAKLGHRLSGTMGGLACIACHGAGGQPSVGVQGPSLSDMAERLDYDWYARWMADPTAMRPGTRMLNVFGTGKSPIVDVHGGDAAKQIDAIWQYLALGSSMPLPGGLVADRSSYELIAAERPVYFGTFYKDASARVMAVGFPERVSAAFDLHNVRLVEVWRGDFINAKGTWDGRAGKLEGAGGIDVLPMPDGPAVAVGASADSWPKGGKAELQMLGHDRSPEGLPTFHYRLRESGVEVSESLTPQLAAGGATLTRSFKLKAPKPVPNTSIRVHNGSEVQIIPVAWTTGQDGAAEFVVEVPLQW